MQKIKAYLLTTCCLLSTLAMADEGMWLPTALPDTLFDIIDEAGGELLAEDIYSEQDSSLKDQVVYLSNGHSGVILSDQGLLLTNYTPFIPFIEKSDSLANGFTALSHPDEIPISNLYALQLRRTVDITAEITKAVTQEYDEAARKLQVDSICQSIYTRYPHQPGHMVQIEKNSNEQYFLYEYIRYDDIRLVYLPPYNMAITPWQSPWVKQRHLADFCLLRLYTARDNTPTAYSTFNQPAQNLSHAIVSQIPKRIGDPVFYLGYPNASNRSLLADELAEKWIDDSTKIMVWDFIAQHQQHPNKLLQEAIERDKTILERTQLLEKKRAKELAFTHWAANHSHFESALRYGNLIPLLHNTYTNRYHHLQQYRINATLMEHVTTLQIALLLLDMNAQNEASTLQHISRLYEKFQPETEKPWLTQVLTYYRTVCDTTYIPEFYQFIDKKYKGNTQKYVDYVFKKSFLTDEKRFTKYLDNPTEKQRSKDPLLTLAKQLKQLQRLHYLLYAQHNPFIERSVRLFRTGCFAKDSTQIQPDANYTLRLGYGSIQGYELNNGISINAFAALNDRNRLSYLYNPVPALDSSLSKALENDTLITDFYTTCDAPYGRMGEAVYNIHGELLGIMTGVNPEAQYNTYYYDPVYQRTLVCDIHYLLFLLEHSDAACLLDEIELGEPEQIVSLQYVDPSPINFVFTRDSIQVNDSTWVVLTDSLLNDSTFVTTHDSLLRSLSLVNDSTAIELKTEPTE